MSSYDLIESMSSSIVLLRLGLLSRGSRGREGLLLAEGAGAMVGGGGDGDAVGVRGGLSELVGAEAGAARCWAHNMAMMSSAVEALAGPIVVALGVAVLVPLEIGMLAIWWSTCWCECDKTWKTWSIGRDVNRVTAQNELTHR